MLQDLAALAPPAIVCVAFLVGAWVLVRRELAPKRRQRAAARQQAAIGGNRESGPASSADAVGGTAGGEAADALDPEPLDADQRGRS